MHASNSTSPPALGATPGPHGFVVRAAAFDLTRHCLDQSSLRDLAPRIGLSTSTLHRLDQQRRLFDIFCPELSTFFLSPEGADFLCRMLLALHIVFGLMGANGCALIGRFLSILELDRFVAASEEAQRQVNLRVQGLLVDYAAAQKVRLAPQTQGKACVLGVDETFPKPGKTLLIAQDLLSGYVLVQQFSEGRDARTWHQAVKAPLDELGLKPEEVVSDQAQGLKGLAKVLGVAHAADLLHVQQPVVKNVVGPIARRRKGAKREYKKAAARAAALLQSGNTEEGAPLRGKQPKQPWDQRAKMLSEKVCEAKVCHKFAKAAVRGISWASHPLELISARWQNGDEIRARFEQMTQMLEASCQGTRAERKEKALKQLKKDLEKIAGQIQGQQTRAEQVLEASNLNDVQKAWMKEVMMPWQYVKQAQEKLPKVEEKRLLDDALRGLEARAWKEAGQVFEKGEAWDEARAIAKKMFEKFQRSTSAVEGYNGVLSLKHHGWHTLPQGKLQAIGILHNYFITREDGTTAAERLFGQKPDDLWGWISNRFDLLPLPRGKPIPSPSARIH